MAHSITYDGDATVAVDAVLKFLASDDYDGDWFVEVTTHDGTTVSGHVEAFVGPVGGGAVTLRPSKDGEPDRSVHATTVNTADVADLYIP